MNIINKEIYNDLELLPIDLQGWNGNSKIFGKIISEIKPSIIIEVGSWKGQSSINMANCIKSENLNTKIYCVDTWLGALEFWNDMKHTPERNLMLKNGYPQIYYQFLSNVVHSNVQDIILPLPATSNIGFKFFDGNSIMADVIYIDASHDYEDVIIDIKNYYKILNLGGIIFGDDYTAWPGVKRAVLEFTSSNNIEFEIYEDNFWIIKKNKP